MIEEATVYPGVMIAGQRVGVVVDLTRYRQLRCGRSREGHAGKTIAVPGRKVIACSKCGARWMESS